MNARPIRPTELPPFQRGIRVVAGLRPDPAPAAPPATGHDFLVMNHRPDLMAEDGPPPCLESRPVWP